MDPRPKIILIAASGTGGHLLPAVQIAKSLKAQDPGVIVEFIGSGRPLETKLVDGAGFKRHVLFAVGVKGLGPLGFLRFILTFPRTFIQVWRLLSMTRPVAVVGVGGYVSVLPVILASLRGVPTWIHEAELKPGMANGLLCWFARRISVAFEAAQIPCKGKVLYTGHPIRQDLREVHQHARSVPPKHLLVLGGSQGAAALDRSVPELCSLLGPAGIEVRHQCRPENVDQVTSAYRRGGLPASVVPFIEDMREAYLWADLVICRAGAGTVMEIEAVNLPAIFVPFPFAQGNHQLANAQTLEAKGKALVVEEGPDFGNRLTETVVKLLDPAFYRRVLEGKADTRSFDAARQIASGILGLVS